MAPNHLDKNGFAKVELIEKSSPEGAHIEDFEIKSENDEMIIIGGGIRASEDPGKLITASYPKADLSSWKVSAKDHIVPDSSPITGFAIGLQIFTPEGLPVSKLELMSFIHVTSVTSDVVSAPSAGAPCWPNCVILGGGFRVNWGAAGSLATSSTFDSDVQVQGKFLNAFPGGWTARSKDHLIPSPASITAYTIAIEEHIILDSGSEYIVIGRFNVGPSTEPVGHQSNVALLGDDFVITGGGSEVFFQGAGNYLWKLHPFIDDQGKQSFSAASKDHVIPDPAKLQTTVFGILLDRPRP